jgi:hypothetical protein
MKTMYGSFVRLTLLLAFLASAVSFDAVEACSSGQAPTDLPRNVELTKAAWDAYRANHFDAAITAADLCIRSFKDDAESEEAQLEKSHAPLPPKGKVTEKEKKAIFDLGVLNDVATCFWIKGSSALSLKKTGLGKDALKSAAKYTYARTWDEHGWFWSPAEDASHQLRDLP